ncbi:hypothetical protein CD143_10720, partial [Staphylococcus felis]
GDVYKRQHISYIDTIFPLSSRSQKNLIVKMKRLNNDNECISLKVTTLTTTLRSVNLLLFQQRSHKHIVIKLNTLLQN